MYFEIKVQIGYDYTQNRGRVMTESEAKEIQKRLEDQDSFELQESGDNIVRSYYFDHVEQSFCRLSIDGETPFSDSIHTYEDFDALYQEVLSQYELSFLEQKIEETMERIMRFYTLCIAEDVDDDAISEMLKERFNYELLIWDRENHVHGYMTPLQALVLRRPAATTSIANLLEQGVNPNKKTGMKKRERTAFFHTCSYAHLREVQLMLPHVDVNWILDDVGAYGKPTALMSCILGFKAGSDHQKERLGTFRLLLESGADINYVHHNGASAIMAIIDYQKIEYFDNIPSDISLNLNYFAEVENWYDNKCTPLSFCAKNWSSHNDLTSIFLKLLELGADINMKDGDGLPPLFYSVRNEVIDIYEQLEVDWTATNRQRQTVLAYYATCNKKKTTIPALLLDRGVDIDAIDENGDTALHIALRNKDSVLAVFLLEQGCRFDIVNHKNESPLDLAKEGQMSIVISKMQQDVSHEEIRIENLCIQILEEGFEYTFGTKKITYRKSGKYESLQYSNRNAEHYRYRNHGCTREWLREYFCALVLKENNTGEQNYFLAFLNDYRSQLNYSPWTMEDVKKQFEESYLSKQIDLIVSVEEVAQVCIPYIKSGKSFLRSDKEGYERYSYDPSTNRFHYKAQGDYQNGEESYTEEEFKRICARVIRRTDSYPYRMDFRGFFFRDYLQGVLHFLGFETWRAWKRAEQTRIDQS